VLFWIRRRKNPTWPFAERSAESGTGDLLRLLMAGFCTFIMLYYGISSFRRARKISRVMSRPPVDPGRTVYPRKFTRDVPQPTVDHAAIRRLRQRPREQRAIPLLLAHGTTGLSVASDLPTQMGLDSDPYGGRGSGRRRAISSLAIWSGCSRASRWRISPRDDHHRRPRSCWLANALVAEQQGADPSQLDRHYFRTIFQGILARGTIFIAAAAAMRIITDYFRVGGSGDAEWNTISISAITSAKPGPPPCRSCVHLCQRDRVH